jgi:GT2 family glycosyltransferase
MTVIVVEYATRPFLPRCLDSLRAQEVAPEQLEVIVVDNASPTPADDLVADYPWVRFLRSPKNLGFAGGCGLALPETRGAFIGIVNPDCVLHPSWVREVLAPMSDETIGIVGSKIYYPDSRILQHTGGILFANGRSEHRGRGEPDVGQYDVLEDQPYVTGAAMAIRREVLDRVGFFSPEYFPAYYEETELCLRARRAGFRVVYAPAAIAWHQEAVASGGGATSTFLRRYHVNRLRFVARNYSLREIVESFLPSEVAFQRRLGPDSEERLICLQAYVEGLRSLLRRDAPARTARTRPTSDAIPTQRKDPETSVKNPA